MTEKELVEKLALKYRGHLPMYKDDPQFESDKRQAERWLTALRKLEPNELVEIECKAHIGMLNAMWDTKLRWKRLT